MKKIYEVKDYCSELGESFKENLPKDKINVIAAPTGSGKTEFFITRTSKEKKIGVLAPFTAITSQIYAKNQDMELKKGLQAQDYVSMSQGMIVSFHSAQRLLEMEHIDYLVIDEIHELINYASFTTGMIDNFWQVVVELKEKFPELIIVALTGTPQFIMKADFLPLNQITIKVENPKAKPSNVVISKSWTRQLNANDSFIYLYNTRRNGMSWARKHDGSYIESSIKETSPAYKAIVNGDMPSERLFTSVLLATGVSIMDPVDYVYTNWGDLVTIVQMSARPRTGGHELRVTRVTHPPYMRGGTVWDLDVPQLDWVENIEQNFKILSRYQNWYSLMVHQDEQLLYETLMNMLWRPEKALPEIDVEKLANF